MLWNLLLGRSITILRKRKNIGQSEAALEANFSPSYLCNVENGRHAVSCSKVVSLCFALKSDPNELWSIFHEEMEKENIYTYLLNDGKTNNISVSFLENDADTLSLPMEDYMHKHCQGCPTSHNYFCQNDDINSLRENLKDKPKYGNKKL